MTQRPQTRSIFVSYAHADSKEMAERLYQDLFKRGNDVWIDFSRTEGGVSWSGAIEDAIDTIDVVLVLMSKAAFRSSICRAEQLRAIRKNKPIVLVLVHSDADRPLYLEELHYIDFSKSEQYPARLNQLIEDIAKAQARTVNSVDIQYKRIEHGLNEAKVIGIQKAQERLSTAAKSVVGQRLQDMSINFLDRENELHSIEHALLKDSIRIINIIGRRGIGKTALASKVMLELETEHLPYSGNPFSNKGVIYMSAQTNNLSLQHLFLSFAELLGGERKRDIHEIWSDATLQPFEKMQTLLELLGGERYIVLLDNLENDLDENGVVSELNMKAFFDALLTIPNALSIITTSRTALQLPPDYLHFKSDIIINSGLSTNNSIKFLRNLDFSGVYGVSDKSDEELSQIAKALYGIPRAMQILVSILCNDPFADLDELLKGIFRNVSIVEKLVDESYRRLDTNSKHIVEAIAVFQKPIPLNAIDYVLEPFSPGLNTTQIIRLLIQTHLVYMDRKKKSVFLHPIDLDYIYSQIPDEGDFSIKVLEKRVAAYYRNIRLPSTHWNSIEDLEPQLAEFDHLIMAGEIDEAARLLDEIDKDYLFWWGYALEVLERRLQLVGKISDRALLVENLSRLAEAYRSLGDYPQAITNYEAAITIARESNDEANLVVWLTSLGHVQQNASRYDEALQTQLEALELVRKLNNRQIECTCLDRIGVIYRSMGLRNAFKYFEEALLLAKALNRTRDIGGILENIGIAHYRFGEASKAVEYLNEALVYARKANDQNAEARALTNLSYAYTLSNLYKEALEVGRRANELSQQRSFKRLIGFSFEYLGRAFIGLEQYGEAITHLEQSLDIARKIKNASGEMQALAGLGVAALQMRKMDAVTQYLLGALQIAEKLSSNPMLGECHMLLGDYYNQVGEFSRAKYYYQRAVDIYEKMEMPTIVELLKSKMS